MPQPLPPRLLARLAAARGLNLLLDYDGTLADIVSDPSQAMPIPGVARLIDQIAGGDSRAMVTIVTGRPIAEVKRLLPLRSRAHFSGVHGMEFTDRDGEIKFIEAALACAPELARVRRWLGKHVPPQRGFWIEDKTVAVGLHYRNADPGQSSRLCARFADFVARDAPSLKLLPLKMMLEAIPRAGGKDLAVKRIKQHAPRSFVTVSFGDDTTDESAFAALDQDDLGILVGPARESFARYRVASPRAVARELRALAAACEERSSVESG
ncbi:MAG: trehalose-phosphatase [Candidatus Binatus sp.]